LTAEEEKRIRNWQYCVAAGVAGARANVIVRSITETIGAPTIREMLFRNIRGLVENDQDDLIWQCDRQCDKKWDFWRAGKWQDDNPYRTMFYKKRRAEMKGTSEVKCEQKSGEEDGGRSSVWSGVDSVVDLEEEGEEEDEVKE
jgi:hypothetical protein